MTRPNKSTILIILIAISTMSLCALVLFATSFENGLTIFGLPGLIAPIVASCVFTLLLITAILFLWQTRMSTWVKIFSTVALIGLTSYISLVCFGIGVAQFLTVAIFKTAIFSLIVITGVFAVHYIYTHSQSNQVLDSLSSSCKTDDQSQSKYRSDEIKSRPQVLSDEIKSRPQVLSDEIKSRPQVLSDEIKSQSQLLPHIVFRNTEGDRKIIVVTMSDGRKQPFYQSTGSNSTLAKTWFPFSCIAEKAPWEHGVGYIFKLSPDKENMSKIETILEPIITQFNSEEKIRYPDSPTYLSYIEGNLWRVNIICELGRFGNLDTMLISAKIAETSREGFFIDDTLQYGLRLMQELTQQLISLTRIEVGNICDGIYGPQQARQINDWLVRQGVELDQTQRETGETKKDRIVVEDSKRQPP